ncbi:dihydrofolate reductase family protein [Micromonospora sp. WMMA1363]|uniref:dihydrofolate reductase family protein n=1 Tax=Micromonospora sp. WMMA1363 TaxID=3053985 RepID=UPI00259CE4FC|nr:dihydrofolate reductase family protein [Micromonospora sp. WMMA1363]MDM4720171.1 dihydrofolate reductase family protein [Micromonospora sp. WMMA1363]
MRKLVYYVASTLDGFIAAPDGSADFFGLEPDLAEHLAAHWPQTLPTVAHPQFGIDRPEGRFDAVMMGRGTYDHALRQGITSPYAHLKQYVFAHSLPPATEPEVKIVSSDPVEFVRTLRHETGGDIWLCGGGHLAGQLLPEVDELVVKLNPIVIGSGVPLAARDFDPRRFTLVDTRPLASGVVILRYARPATDGTAG